MKLDRETGGVGRRGAFKVKRCEAVVGGTLCWGCRRVGLGPRELKVGKTGNPKSCSMHTHTHIHIHISPKCKFSSGTSLRLVLFRRSDLGDKAAKKRAPFEPAPNRTERLPCSKLCGWEQGQVMGPRRHIEDLSCRAGAHPDSGRQTEAKQKSPFFRYHSHSVGWKAAPNNIKLEALHFKL